MSFGVSGKLYNSTVLLYDRQTHSLWSQLQKEAIAGPLTGERLQLLPSLQTTWKRWKSLYPDTLVLSRDSGFRIDYDVNPYADYQASDALMFPVPKRSKERLANKEKVAGITIDGTSKAYPFSRLKKRTSSFEDVVGGKKVEVSFDRESQTVSITDEHRNSLPVISVYWFAWQAFHPDTLVYR